MPAVRGRTISTIGGFLTPIWIDGGDPRKGGVLVGRGLFTITKTARGIFTVTKTARGTRGV